ncbi:hypothetical protein [Actinomadura kijaniata]|uniref:hypothetical protein n=1 Tax=Actinomadura kijaniata TaxID=46161 RepID=UPI00082DB5A2|nr:hypothetical protein [Actinomadura kijaniata]
MRAVLASVLVAAALTGCAQRQGGQAAAAATAVLVAAQRGDGAGACAGLVPSAAESLETQGRPCAEEIVKLGLRSGPTDGGEVWGDAARVRVGADTVFLFRWGDGWKVAAAGCRPRAGRPYECRVRT